MVVLSSYGVAHLRGFHAVDISVVVGRVMLKVDSVGFGKWRSWNKRANGRDTDFDNSDSVQKASPGVP